MERGFPSREALNRAFLGIARPRAAGSPADSQVRAELLTRLSAAGLEAREQPFSYSFVRPLRAMRSGLLCLAAAVAILVVAPPRTPFALGAGLLLAMGGWLLWQLLKRDSFFFPAAPAVGEPMVQTANVVAELPAAVSRDEDRVEVPARTVLLVAHHDTKSQNISILLRALLLIVAIVGALAACTWWIAGAVGPAGVSLRAAGLLGALAFAALAAASFEDRSPGALDNAASMLAVIEAARCLIERPVSPPLRLIILLPGAEEHFMAGARYFLRMMSRDLPRSATLVLNVDGIGSPGPQGIVAASRLAAWVQEGARAHGVALRRVWMPPGSGTDAVPFETAAYRALTLTSGALSRAVLAVHTEADTPERVDPRSVSDAALLLEALVRSAATSWPEESA